MVVRNTFLTMPQAAPRLRRGSLFMRYGIGAALLIASFFSQDFLPFFFGALVFLFFHEFFFNVQVPPVILFIFFFQWFFNQGQLINALRVNQPLEKMFFPGHTIVNVYFLGMIGTAAFLLGVLYFYRKIRVRSFEEFRQMALQFNVDRLLVLYIATYPVLGAALSLVWLFPGVTQPLIMLMYFKWSIFFLLFICVLMHNKYKFILAGLFFFEFFSGLGSFWASFKDVAYVSFIAYWIFYFRGNVLVRWSLPIGIVLMVYLGSIWSYIKQDYRNYMSGGTGRPGSIVTRDAALDKFSDLFVAASTRDVEQGFDQLMLRMSWIGAFNRVYNHVPSKVPHQGGEMWTNAVLRPITPRLLFPGKTRLSDSQELNQYSGLDVDERNTSISLSMIAGSYVDLGPWRMHIPLLLFGLAFGWVYKKLFDMSKNFLMGYALSIPLIFLIHINEQSMNRLVSSLVLFFLVAWFICKFLQGPLLRFLVKRPVTATIPNN